ncbi:hypothetical protein [Desulfonema magnum]|uniref:Uncharacterized protein n=1 Tax=Desulfonema magnum TaxID=45655 RepID=A0A975GJY4_9BACT|nr:hypothetical protein [Desulfonema magnum]QTA84146.1 Uncharacterized protein dnm_001390 [Desulfonema magnum]
MKIMKILFVFIFFWGLGTAGLYVLIQSLLSGDGRVLVTEFQNPLIKYSLVFTVVDFSMLLFSFPVLIYKGMIGDNAEKHVKAGTDLAVLLLAAPGFIFAVIGGYYAGADSNRLFLLIIFYLFMLILDIVTFLSERGKRKSGR